VPSPVSADIVVNATSVGLHEGALPLDDVDGPQVALDLVYGVETAFAGWARGHGATFVDGLEVLVRQGALSFERWTGVPAPLDAMRAAAGVQARGDE
jgi:shikimate dehydrogenase